jgi:hypothetical protein
LQRRNASLLEVHFVRWQVHKEKIGCSSCANMNTGEDIRFLKYWETAKSAWLEPFEVYDILVNFKESGLIVSHKPPVNPKAGEIYLFDQKMVRRFRQDGMDYVKKHNRPESVREDFYNVVVSSVKKLQVSYAKANPVGDTLLDRRVYKRIDCPKLGRHMAFVHYLPTGTKKPHTRKPRTTRTVFENGPFRVDPVTLDGAGGDRWNGGNVGFLDDVCMGSPGVSLLGEYKVVDFAPSVLIWGFDGKLVDERIILVLQSMLPHEGLLLDVEVPEQLFLFIENGSVDYIPCIPLSLDTYKVILPSDFHVTKKMEVVEMNIVAGDRKRVCSNSFVMRSRQLFVGEEAMLTKRAMSSGVKRTRGIEMQKNGAECALMSASYDHDGTLQKDGEIEAALDSSSRTFKIRMVEKLSRIDKGKAVHEELADLDLEEMSDQDLEQFSEQTITQMFMSLSEIADEMVGDQLRNELVSLDENGLSLVHLLCLYDYPSTIPTLLDVLSHGQDGQQSVVAAVNMLTKDGSTPLHLAASNGHHECVLRLLDAGASASVRDNIGQTPADAAIERGHLSIAELLGSRERFKPSLVGHAVVESWDTKDTKEHSSSRIMSISPAMNVSPPSTEKKGMFVDALQNLSLHDKCALRLGIKNSERDRGYSESDDDINSVLSEADLASIISDSDYQLETIVSAMNDDERAVLRDDVVKIQKNVKRWLMQKNFENIRQAALKVASRRRTTLTRREFVQKKKAATALQAAARGLRDRREFQQIRQRASATLVINRHVREWMRRKKSIHLETVMEHPSKPSSGVFEEDEY